MVKSCRRHPSVRFMRFHGNPVIAYRRMRGGPMSRSGVRRGATVNGGAPFGRVMSRRMIRPAFPAIVGRVSVTAAGVVNGYVLLGAPVVGFVNRSLVNAVSAGEVSSVNGHPIFRVTFIRFTVSGVFGCRFLFRLWFLCGGLSVCPFVCVLSLCGFRLGGSERSDPASKLLQRRG